MAGCRREFHRFAVHAGGSVQQNVETRIDGDALRPLDEYFRIFRFDSVQLCSIKPPLCGRIGSRHGERLHESLHPDGQSSRNQFYPSQRIRVDDIRRNGANLGDRPVFRVYASRLCRELFLQNRSHRFGKRIFISFLCSVFFFWNDALPPIGMIISFFHLRRTPLRLFGYPFFDDGFQQQRVANRILCRPCVCMNLFETGIQFFFNSQTGRNHLFS